MNSLNNLDNQFRRMLNNKSVVSVLSLLLALYAGAAAPKLPNEVVLFFDSVLGKTLFMFLIVYLSSRNTQLSIMVAVAFLVTLSCMNKRNLEGFKDGESSGGEENNEDEENEDEENEEGDGTEEEEEGEEEEPEWHKDTPHDHTHDEEEEEDDEEDESEQSTSDPVDSGEGFKNSKKGKKVKEHFRYSFKKHKYTPAPVPVRENFQNYAPFPRKR
jgi:hypothetical protein